MIPERWDPLIIYLDMSAIGQIPSAHRPLGDLGKSVHAFLDWSIGRYNEIDSILIGAYMVEPSGEYFNLPQYRPIEQSFIDALFWAIDNDPIYTHLSEKMQGKINIIPPNTLESINASPALFITLITPPNIILTGIVSSLWVEKNTHLLRRLAEPFILFDKYGTTEGLNDLSNWEAEIQKEIKRIEKLNQ